MKKFLELGNRYAKKSDWKDLALVKFCLCSMGIMIGLLVPEKMKNNTMKAAAGVFVATYIPLMAKVFLTIKEMLEENDEQK